MADRSTATFIDLLEMLTYTEFSNQQQMILMKEHFQSVEHSVAPVVEAESVCGVTSLRNELYVLRGKDEEQVEIYNIDNIDTTSSLRRLTVPELTKGGMVDMTSCQHNSCLYISDVINKCVHKVELQEDNVNISSWLVNDSPRGLSVTSQFTVLVTCSDTRTFKEFSTDGERIQVITLDEGIVHPLHAIKLTPDHFIVCHGEYNDPVHQVCKVDANGSLVQAGGSYFKFKQKGSEKVGKLEGPRHLAIDTDLFVYVADVKKRRVLLLIPNLKFVGVVVSADQLKFKPHRLYLDTGRRRLYVADTQLPGGGRVLIVTLH
jgi:hypothetical protein